MSALSLAPGLPIRLEGEIEYVTGSTVSRVLAKTAGGSLTLFAFDSGQGLSEHSSPYEAFVQILEGAAEVSVAGRPVEARAGQMVALPANVPHALHARERFKMLLSMVRD